MTKLKTIKLKGKDYVQVNERVMYFNDTYKDGMITAEATFNNNTVYFKASVFPDSSNYARFFTGHSFGELGKEKALEKLETVAVGRALAFMGIGIIESIASSDEMANFQNKEELVKVGFCNICGEQGIKSPKSGQYFCPNWKQHKADGDKWKLVQPDSRSEEEKKFAKELDEIPVIQIDN